MKTLVAIALIVFGAFMSYVFIGGFLDKTEENKSSQSNVQQEQTSTNNDTQQQTQTDIKTYSAAEVATKNSRDNCWLIINGKVYDVTKFLSEHPGGVSAITPYCGKEASKAFETQDQGSGGGHSSSAQQMLSSYFIGNLQ